MRRLVADRDVPVVLAYALDVSTDRPVEDDTVGDAFEEVNERLLLAERAGIDRSQVTVAPGTGLGGRAPNGFEVLDRLPEFRGLGTPIGIGHGDAGAFGERGRGSDAAVASAAAMTALAVERGVDLVRTRDVPGTVAAVAAAESTVRTE
jgi:dihydropteroate synthase